VARLTIQDHLREKVSECCGELEGMFDDFIASGAKMSADFKPLMLMRGMNISPNMISTVARVWELRLAEFNEVLDGEDPQLIEGYSHLTKIQLRNCVKFCETVINDCNSYVQLKKVERKPRPRKLSPEKKAAKFKICAEFVNSNSRACQCTTWLTRVKPGCMIPKNANLSIVADEYGKVLPSRTTAVIGFDAQNRNCAKNPA
jgi:hypothetical protein